MLWTWERLKWNGWKPCHSVIFFFVCLFLWADRERKRKKKGKGKSYTASKEMKIHTWQRSCQKTSKRSLKTLSEKHTAETHGKIVPKSFFFFFFFKCSATRRYFKELLLPLHSLPPFPKHDEQMKEPREGWCRLGSPLSFYLPSPHTSLPHSPSPPPPTAWLKSAPWTPACFWTAVMWEDFKNLLVDIVPLFRFQ